MAHGSSINELHEFCAEWNLCSVFTTVFQVLSAVKMRRSNRINRVAILHFQQSNFLTNPNVSYKKCMVVAKLSYKKCMFVRKISYKKCY